MSEQPNTGTDASPWQVYVCENYGPVNPARVWRVVGWDAMVAAVRREIERCGKSGDQGAETDAASLLDWLDRSFRARDYSLRLTFFHVGRDSVCVQLREPVGGAS
jgi:hypothetical protein